MSASQTILGFVDARRAETRSSSPSSSSSDSESLRLSSSEDEEDEEDGPKEGAVPGDASRPTGSQTGRRGLAAMIGRVGGHRAAKAPGPAGARNAASPARNRPPVQPAMTPHSAASPVTV